MTTFRVFLEQYLPLKDTDCPHQGDSEEDSEGAEGASQSQVQCGS